MLDHRLIAGWMAALTIAGGSAAGAQPPPEKIKVIVDQDARGPCSTDMQSVLMFVQSPRVEVLGITIVSGDLWMDQETLHTLRALEIAGRTDIPVYRGAVFPILNSKEETERWEMQYGRHLYKGAWNDGMPGPYERVPLPEGEPTTKPTAGHAANFIVDAVNAHPGEVVLWGAGPLTNIALALMLDPELPAKAKELVLMGGGIDRAEYRKEFNWLWDPEAARKVLRAPWKKVTITPVDISVKTRHGPELVARIGSSPNPVAQYIKEFHRTSPPDADPDWQPWIFMWDEISAAAVLDPTIITEQREMYVDVDIDHGINYGYTLAWELDQQHPPDARKAWVQFDLDLDRFYDLYADLMMRRASPD
ncbi:MAG: nucleoside hydrolase [Acidobacteriota bacterium]|nr:nucleoside hydrolase [Acidobacteriota bacterium]MDH3522812.1 nucleoside hydrolase [Acidobacteriota bacterium]